MFSLPVFTYILSSITHSHNIEQFKHTAHNKAVYEPLTFNFIIISSSSLCSSLVSYVCNSAGKCKGILYKEKRVKNTDNTEYSTVNIAITTRKQEERNKGRIYGQVVHRHTRREDTIMCTQV